MKQWKIYNRKADFRAISQQFGIDPVVARIIRNREIVGEENIRRYLTGTMSEIPSPWLLKDMKKAVDIILKKIQQGKRIRIIGDYDIDGVTATYILVKGLTRLGANADTYIPDRVADGYGIHIHLVEHALKDQIDTIITCDNGIAAFDEIAYAKKSGMTVIVTDHHEVPFEMEQEIKKYKIPQADAIINHKQPDCPYPEKTICGAVVAFKLVAALYEACGISAKELEDFYEIIAIATVGDVMILQGENRIIVKEGLRRLHTTKNLGLRALIEVNNLQDSNISAFHIGFVLGPCINASGRLDTALRSLRLLEASTYQSAKMLAGDLFALNASRKDLTEKWKNKAFEQIESDGTVEDSVLVVYLPECHESLAGIIAGRIREKYNKPTFVLTDSEQGVKGSGRSIDAYCMHEELTKCAQLLEKFGGHAMAAGLSLKKENVTAFREMINQNCTLQEEDLAEKIMVDVEVPFYYVTREFIHSLSVLEPCGNGNKKPVFALRNVRVLKSYIVGKNRNVLKMLLEDKDGYKIEGVYFGEVESFQSYVEEHEIIKISYYPEINIYQGIESIQIRVTNYE